MLRAVRAAVAAAALAASARAGAGVAESWYLSRARANAQIGNHAAAIEAYEKALAENPRSREASRGLGLSRLRNGETDRAVAEFDRHLARFPDDAELAFEQARILQWSRYAYRARDASRFLEMGLAVRDDPARRLELARLLGRDRATLDRALAEYDRLLARAPADRTLRDERLNLLLWDPRRRADALRELERREAERPDDEGARRDLARLLADDPARAGEAAGRYDALLARRPADPDLLAGRARALSRAGRRAEAREAWARAIAVRPSPEARLEYADLLAAEPATRGAARLEYEAVLRDAPRSRRARLGLARVLMARKETSGAAAAQYREVLRAAPADAEAHEGLARAYAWNGDADRALAHGELAARARARDPGATSLERTLRRGREPSLGAGARALSQGGGWGLSSLAAFGAGAAEPTPFTSSAAEAGVVARRGDGLRAEGAFVDARGEWRASTALRLRASGGWDGSRRAGRATGEVALDLRGPVRTLSVGVARAARADSFRALAGEAVDGRTAGAASETCAEVRASWDDGARRLRLAARAGEVTGPAFPATFAAAASARADLAVFRRGAWTAWAGASLDATHHARDLSGAADPLAPRLFSPPLFAAITPRLAIGREGAAGSVALEAGPALQLTSGPGGGVRLGGDARVSLARRLGDRLRLTLDGRAERVASAYGRAEVLAGAALLF
ncbi:MAG TPA: tetratricopeptide repeat protein [Anaeromyxobacter sp.]|nr:tetratricopeptide repeat protein [Anaeromyxobacter sp.]